MSTSEKLLILLVAVGLVLNALTFLVVVNQAPAPTEAIDVPAKPEPPKPTPKTGSSTRLAQAQRQQLESLQRNIQTQLNRSLDQHVQKLQSFITQRMTQLERVLTVEEEPEPAAPSTESSAKVPAPNTGDREFEFSQTPAQSEEGAEGAESEESEKP